MNKNIDIKLRTVQSLIQKAMNNIEKEMKNDYVHDSPELALAKEQLNNAVRIVLLLHQGATCINRPHAEFQIIQSRPVKTPGYVASYLGLGSITIDCRNEVTK